MERLQKLMSRAGIASRRESENIILAGRVSVNGQIVRELGYKASAIDQIAVDGKIIVTEQKQYIMLNKPKGYITTAKDERGRKTVLELLPELRERLYPIGRLDYDTEGLLLLTNDGELTNKLIHPRFKVDKTYVAVVNGIPTESALKRLRTGIELDDGLTAPAKVTVLEAGRGMARVQITIHEGRKRQVRRMFLAAGHRVISLKRIAFAFLSMRELASGKCRRLTADEVQRLYALSAVDQDGRAENGHGECRQ